MTAAAFAIVFAPFLVALVKLLAAPGHKIDLPDDLALIDFHTRRALAWQQQLGVFDRYGWNHPGPSYFYLLSIAYRILGSGARTMFIGATTLNMLAAGAVVEVVRRRTGPARALWAATWVCFLASVLAITGPVATTYSEGPLGALVSPWNPTIVIFPLLLFTVLCASSVDRSPRLLIAALVVGSFVVQTDISVLPVVAGLFVASAATCLVLYLADRRDESDIVHATVSVADPRPPSTQGSVGQPHWWWSGLGSAVFVLMWIPPVIQQLTNHPGNFTLLVRFFTSGRTGQTAAAGAWSVVSAFAVLAEGPGEVMNAVLGSAPAHAVVGVVISASVAVVGTVTIIIGARQKNRVATGLAALGLIGCLVAGAAVTRVVGFVFGYLVIWAIALPIAILIAVGLLEFPIRLRGTRVLRLLLCTVGIVIAGVAATRTAAMPPLSTVSDPQVGQLVSLVTPAVGRNGTVYVDDANAGAGGPNWIQLIDIERFIGLVNRLDQGGYHPVVGPSWKSEFGPGYLTNGHDTWVVRLTTWQPSSLELPGYRGKVGDMSVVVDDGPGYQSISPHAAHPASTSAPG
ncbi:MAG: hypothetical protein M0007_04455 [Actinomycetota bacterium]|jgi:hypothetical protein|nr:hypothetical protein [Actinomycetota bacterium]